MFSDIGALELVTLVVLAVLVFGPDKLPKVIQDVSRFIRKVREFSDSAKNDIRSELGPEFKDFEFEDLNPKTFLRKQLENNEDLRELKDLRGTFDLKKEMNEVADAVHGRETLPAVNGSATGGTAAGGAAAGTPDLLKKRDEPGAAERPPYDSDAT
ncbi:sec-independent translocase [Streptomyces sp. WAC08241]|uniref:sec-independent translocase n=1 Tax=Streptomyces sp. WAC08241 TaxID=2487421 RepID=UPI000F797303|nr:sec-independent translocase [Streptomyces sp. WAC08241]RSS45853.1 Sec-independent protein translocase subunit TatB [Streptomyces sp. WAC08241]